MTAPSPLTVIGLPPVPPAVLDPYLDAAALCFARHGLRRTRVTDIAEAVGVSRVTVYRQLGTTEEAARLLLARELDRLVSSLLPALVAADDVDGIVAVIASAVDFAVTHPVMRKVLHDEADLVGAFVMNEFRTVIDRLLLLAEPVVQRLEQIAGGRDINVPVVAEWVARVVLTMVVAPPTAPPEVFLGGVLRPLLAVTGGQD
ncbi:MAG TPA: TetR/AcrR family transcriptional regulator [Acidimicrobiales bacterium]|nr:TetR/AcrR family transcriptional regulator [Acidimicrobiales bacterium]